MGAGHGFKMAPAVGEALADLVTGGVPAFDLRLHAIPHQTAARL